MAVTLNKNYQPYCGAEADHHAVPVPWAARTANHSLVSLHLCFWMNKRFTIPILIRNNFLIHTFILQPSIGIIGIILWHVHLIFHSFSCNEISILSLFIIFLHININSFTVNKWLHNEVCDITFTWYHNFKHAHIPLSASFPQKRQLKGRKGIQKNPQHRCSTNKKYKRMSVRKAAVR